MSHLIIAERAGGILHLSLNRPEKKNALTQEMYSLLAEQFEQAEHDPSVRVVALSGRGGQFHRRQRLVRLCHVASST